MRCLEGFRCLLPFTCKRDSRGVETFRYNPRISQTSPPPTIKFYMMKSFQNSIPASHQTQMPERKALIRSLATFPQPRLRIAISADANPPVVKYDRIWTRREKNYTTSFENGLPLTRSIEQVQGRHPGGSFCIFPSFYLFARSPNWGISGLEE